MRAARRQLELDRPVQAGGLRPGEDGAVRSRAEVWVAAPENHSVVARAVVELHCGREKRQRFSVKGSSDNVSTHLSVGRGHTEKKKDVSSFRSL